jgi:hypothetical protein
MSVGGITREAMVAFNEARLEKQYELFGQCVTYVAKTGAPEILLLGCHSEVRSNKELRDGGFALMHDFVCRLRKSEYPDFPRVEGELTVGPVTYRIAEVIDHPISGEWKLGLRSNVA